MISSAAVARVREATGIVDVIQPYVRLRKSGATMTGLCPFHKDSNASFSVSPDKGLFHCFGCGAAGDAFTFLERIEGWNFKQALGYLAERTGVSLAPTPRVIDNSKRHKAQVEADDSEWYWRHVRQSLVLLAGRARYLEREACRRFTPETVPETAWLVFILLDGRGKVADYVAEVSTFDDVLEGALALIDADSPVRELKAYLSLSKRARRVIHRSRLQDEDEIDTILDDLNAVFAAHASNTQSGPQSRKLQGRLFNHEHRTTPASHEEGSC